MIFADGNCRTVSLWADEEGSCSCLLRDSRVETVRNGHDQRGPVAADRASAGQWMSSSSGWQALSQR